MDATLKVTGLLKETLGAAAAGAALSNTLINMNRPPGTAAPPVPEAQPPTTTEAAQGREYDDNLYERALELAR